MKAISVFVSPFIYLSLFVCVLVSGGNEEEREVRVNTAKFPEAMKASQTSVQCVDQNGKNMFRCRGHLNCWWIQDFKTVRLSFFFFLSLPDEKEKFEPTVFRDTIVQGLNEAGNDLEAIAKFLDATGSRLDYRRYADTLFDILVAGSMLGKLQCTQCKILRISLASFKMLSSFTKWKL